MIRAILEASRDGALLRADPRAFDELAAPVMACLDRIGSTLADGPSAPDDREADARHGDDVEMLRLVATAMIFNPHAEDSMADALAWRLSKGQRVLHGIASDRRRTRDEREHAAYGIGIVEMSLALGVERAAAAADRAAAIGTLLSGAGAVSQERHEAGGSRRRASEEVAKGEGRGDRMRAIIEARRLRLFDRLDLIVSPRLSDGIETEARDAIRAAFARGVAAVGNERAIRDGRV